MKTLRVDFALSGRPDYLLEQLQPILELDVSILVNNVGVDVLDYYHRLTEQQVLNLVTINCIAGSLLARMFIPRFEQRHRLNKGRSAIVNVSSLAG